ncbi:glycine rich domain-containing protein [Clostridioides difficile]|uniref:glycine rich domain-containing protein n=1 Tax=Clostridioides difficile TaxID=1496 RepID=UPI001FFDCBBA|nr:glycine rich domain-containing protein [Clostridioides difficile]WOW20763.1 glycine rich domain-containing protein [Clostridioides difficile]WOW39697.1 glycine rich domain-containing protein [Clostridioides difficile]
MTTEWNFNYIGTGKKVILKPGKYKLECWGASGGGRFDEWTECAKGGYSKGELTLKKETILYVYAGESGYKKFSNISDWAGFNGGGRGPNEGVDPKFTTCGGGATDIRLIGGVWNDEQGLLSRIIVAGGGGSIGTSSFSSIGLGGGFAGGMGVGAGTTCTGGTQYEGGVTVNSNGNGSFGKGGIGNVCAGGGGWYGGAGASSSGVGGGGSGYVLTKDSYKPKGYIPTSEYWLENVNSIAGDNTSNAHGYAKITLLQALPFLNISSYNSSTATFKADHTDPTLLTKIEYFIDDVLKETITTDLTLEKTINYTLEDNALHTLKIVVTDSANATVEKVVSISKGIAPLPAGSTTDEVTSKWIEIKDAFKSGKTSIINTLALKNIEASLNNTIVELSEKIKASFDSGDASLQELQNRITELTNQLSQRIKWASGTFVASEKTNLPFVVPTNLTFVPKIIIMERSSFLDSSSPLLSVEGGSISNLNNIHFNASWVGSTRVASFITRIESISESSFTVTGSSINSAIKFPVYISKGTSIKWYAFDII